MRNWEAIIKVAEDEDAITHDEAAELREQSELLKEAGVFGSAKKLLITKPLKYIADNLHNVGDYLVNNKELLIGGAVAVPVAAEVMSTAVKPIKNELAYHAMLKQLQRVSPGSLKLYDSEHIRNVYGMVRTLAPIISSNATLAAIAVRDGLDMPQSFNLDVLSRLARIQKDSISAQDIKNRMDGAGDNVTGVVSKATEMAKTMGVYDPNNP